MDFHFTPLTGGCQWDFLFYSENFQYFHKKFRSSQEERIYFLFNFPRPAPDATKQDVKKLPGTGAFIL
jgi:hypothetical protein